MNAGRTRHIGATGVVRELTMKTGRIGEAQVDVERQSHFAAQRALVRSGQVGETIALNGRNLCADDRLLVYLHKNYRERGGRLPSDRLR